MLDSLFQPITMLTAVYFNQSQCSTVYFNQSQCLTVYFNQSQCSTVYLVQPITMLDSLFQLDAFLLLRAHVAGLRLAGDRTNL